MAIKKKLIHIFLFLILSISTLYIYFVPKVELAGLFFDRNHIIYNTTLTNFFLNQALLFDSKDGTPPPYAYYQLARINFIQGNLNTALDFLSKEEHYYPDHSKVLYIRGLTLGYLGRDNEAIASFAKYVQENPESWAGRNDLSWLLFKEGRFKEAIAVIEPAYITNPANPWVLNTYGILLMNTGDLKKSHEILSSGYKISLMITENGWGMAYPGNNPSIYNQGLESMRNSFLNNLQLVEQKLKQVK